MILDFRLTDGTGADAGAGIRQIRPETKLIFLTREDSDAARFAALESGASAFIHKSRAASEVVDAIRVVAGGGTSITPRTIAALLNKRRSMDAQLESLTPREKEVLRPDGRGRLEPRKSQASWGSATRPSDAYPQPGLQAWSRIPSCRRS